MRRPPVNLVAREHEYRWLAAPFDPPAGVGAFVKRDEVRLRVQDTYFDGPALELSTGGFRLRVRLEGSALLTTFKGPSAGDEDKEGFSSRFELEVAVNGSLETSTPFLAAREHLTGELALLGFVDTTRTVHLYEAADEVRVELCLDRVTYQSGAVEYRVEAEGPEPWIHPFARELVHRHPGLSAAPRGKVNEMLARTLSWERPVL